MIFCETVVLFLVALAFAAQPGFNSSLDDGDLIHQPVDRTTWGNFDIHTDYDDHWPETGVVREYWLTIENVTLAPDGYDRKNVLAYNGSVPGPIIEAEWGDTIKVNFRNNLQHNGTGIHWHGMRMLNNNLNDGVSGVTECPLPPGAEKTYTFKATQYGTSWYHSHFSLQYGEGASGPIVIHGPASANYDEDLGPMFIQDWHHESVYTVFERWHDARARGLPVAPNALINGSNICSGADACDGKGTRYRRELQRGVRYRLRLINGCVDNHVKVSIDAHKLTVIAADFVPIQPFETEWLDLAIGQRYDVLFTITDTSHNSFWFRSVAQDSCSYQANLDNVLGILSVSPVSSNPTTSAHPMEDFCLDPPSSSLLPIVQKPPPPLSRSPHTLSTNLTQSPLDGKFTWTINNTPLTISWDNPTAYSLHPTGPNTLNIATEWAYILITSAVNISHPIHLHGHDFHILEETRGGGDGGEGAKVLANPPRRDTATLPAGGTLLIAFRGDNPGVWLMHCHIAFHVSMGFSVQFVERPEEMRMVRSEEEDAVCRAWREYNSAPVWGQADSGI